MLHYITAQYTMQKFKLYYDDNKLIIVPDKILLSNRVIAGVQYGLSSIYYEVVRKL